MNNPTFSTPNVFTHSGKFSTFHNSKRSPFSVSALVNLCLHCCKRRIGDLEAILRSGLPRSKKSAFILNHECAERENWVNISNDLEYESCKMQQPSYSTNKVSKNVYPKPRSYEFIVSIFSFVCSQCYSYCIKKPIFLFFKYSFQHAWAKDSIC